MKAIASLFPLILGILVVSAAEAADPDVPQPAVNSAFQCSRPFPDAETSSVLQSVESRYAEIADLHANFSQQSYFVGLQKPAEESRGEVSFKRPGMMDWLYEPPNEQRFVADGKSVWWYQKKENQVHIRDLQESFSSDVPVSFLLGVGKLRENFKLDSACITDAGILLKLRPLKPNATLDEFHLLIDSKTRAPIGARVLELQGNETAILFSNVKTNSGLSEKHFTLDIPKGTDIIDERSEQGSWDEAQ
jgi:outer membrane lipoprotein carrier protein